MNGDDEPGAAHAGEQYVKLGLERFHAQDYAGAECHFAAAVEANPANADCRALLEHARVNARSEIAVHVPDLIRFERDPLLAPPSVAPGALPTTPPARPERGLLARWHRDLGYTLGVLATQIMEMATTVYGTVAGYRDRLWTNWYRRPIVLGILTLAHMRNRLNRRSLRSTYPPGALIGFQPTGQKPPPGVEHYRTANGSWNNIDDPMEGAAGTRFLRNVSNESITAASESRLLEPNPREISRRLLTRRGPMLEVPFLNLLAASWIQFQNHDWVNHGEMLFGSTIDVPLAEDDPARRRYRQTTMFVGRTQPDPTRMEGLEETPLTFINEVTHWWDGSQIYGSDQATVDRLRSGVDGKLRLLDDHTLPIDRKGVEETGFVRNWWVGLTMLHTLFTREHNAICDRLKQKRPAWDDTRLFNVARLVNAAVMAKIHTVEWTPAVLPNPGLDRALNANWFGLLTNLFRSDRHRRTVAEINVQNPEMGGVVGNALKKHGCPYGLTEEFVEVYRLHSFLPETLTLKMIAGADAEEVPLPATRQAGSRKITRRFDLADLFFSFGTQHPGQLVLNNYPRFMQEMSIPGNPLFDLGAVDILRARERGVPRYNEFRRQLGLNPILSFEDLTNDADHVRALTDVYGRHAEAVEDLDLMIGTLAEDTDHRPSGFGFGETMFQIFILNATRRLQADRFYTTHYDEATYTKPGLDWIDDADFKTVLLRHYPQLAATGLANVRNAFEPWDGDRALCPDRHPLRAYDKTLGGDPWTGDAFR